MTTRIKLRRDTATNWAEANPILAAGEPGLEIDTGSVKYGDGITAWNSLDYSGGGDSLTDDHAVTITVGNTEYWAIVNRANNNGQGVEANAVAYDSEDNMITLHLNNGSGSSREKLVISKFDTAANLLWQKQIDHETDTDIAHDICVDSNDNIFVAYSADDTLRPNGIDSIVIVKLTPDGTVLWQKNYQGNVGVNVSDSNVPLVSNTVSTTTFGGNAAQSIEIDTIYGWNSTGLVFSQTTDDITFTTIGTVLGELRTENGTTILYFAAGTFGGNLDADTYNYKLAGTAPYSFQEIGAVVCDGTDIYFAGEYIENSPGESSPNGIIVKVSGANGNLVWSKIFGLGGPSATKVYGMDIGADGNLVTVGVVDDIGTTNAVISKFSGVDGSHIWSKVVDVGDYNTGGDVVVDSLNNVFVTVNSRQEILHNDNNQLNTTITHIMKLNSLGVQQWTRRIGPGPCASVATGIDCDSTGNVYLSALTVAQENPTRENNYYENTARNVLLVAKYSTLGTVLWQRYIEAEGYFFIPSEDEYNDSGLPGAYYYNKNRGRYLSLNNSGKLAVQVGVLPRNFDQYTYNTLYRESITFQIDQDGRELTIGNGNERFTVKASRVPGKFVTLDVASLTNNDVTVTDLSQNLLVTTTTFTVTDGELAQQIAKSAPYEYVFGNDGTLTIPNDGDIKLVQTQIGWFSIFGSANDSYNDVWIRANCVDTDTGDVYVVGQDDDSSKGFIARYNSQGQILWSIRLYDNDENWNTRCNAVKIHPTRGNVIVLCEYYGNVTGALVVEIDPDTARVINSFGFRDQNTDGAVEAYDFDFFSNGDLAVVGRKYDEFTSIAVVPQTGSTTSELVILNSAISSAGVSFDNNWVVSGTGITGRAAVQYVNRYTGVTGTVRQGSGATFDIINNGNGTYSVGIVSGGTNYLPGHKIKILGTSLTAAENTTNFASGTDYTTGDYKVFGDGTTSYFALQSDTVDPANTKTLLTSGDAVSLNETSLGTISTAITGSYGAISGTSYYGWALTSNIGGVGIDANLNNFTIGNGTAAAGATPDNDIIITVQAVSEGGVISGVGNTGTAAGTFTATATAVSGTNHNVGSGLTFTFDGNDGSTYTEHSYNITAAGTNYVTGDVITISGTQLGGTSPANDLTATVSATDGAVTQFNTFSGTQQTTTRKITISDAVDFSGEGTWAVGYPLGGEAFALRYAAAGTITWSKVLSGGGENDSGERYFSVAVGSDNAVYAAGEMYSRGTATVGDLVSYQCAVVTKFNSSGVPQWTKALNDDLFNCSAKCVVVQGTTLAVSHFTQNNSDTVITKLDTAGNIKWQRSTDSNDDSSVAIDSNGDIYAVVESNFETRYEDIIKVIKFAPNGEISYRKFIGTLTDDYSGTNEYFKNGRNLTLDADHMYISGYTTAPDDNFENGFLVKLPKTGDCDGSYGIWAYQTEEYDVNAVISTEATTFTPNVGTGNWETWTPDFGTQWYDPSNDSYYHIMEEIRDRDGGAIEFADGTRQTSSAQQIPQHLISNGADYRLTLEDMGKHIYVVNNGTKIIVPYHEDAPLPIGFTVVIVNNSGGTVSIDADGGGITIIVPGDTNGQYWDLGSPGMATLLKVDEFTWFMTGNVELD